MILKDGFKTIVSFAENEAVKFEEIDVTPPPIEGGGSTATSTMRNTKWRTFSPKKLFTLGQMQMTAAYDPEIYDDILEMVNVNQLITVTFPDGSKLAFWGWLDNFTPGSLVEGDRPTAAITVVSSNQNASGVETDPDYTAPPAPPPD